MSDSDDTLLFVRYFGSARPIDDSQEVMFADDHVEPFAQTRHAGSKTSYCQAIWTSLCAISVSLQPANRWSGFLRARSQRFGHLVECFDKYSGDICRLSVGESNVI